MVVTRSMSEALVLLALLPLAACGGSSGAGRAPGSGVDGQTVVDAGCPVQRAGTTCPLLPVRAHLTITAERGQHPSATVDTASVGRFRVALAPGRYEVGGRASGSPSPLAPLAVVVTAGRFTTVRVVFDSGVRTVR